MLGVGLFRKSGGVKPDGGGGAFFLGGVAIFTTKFQKFCLRRSYLSVNISYSNVLNTEYRTVEIRKPDEVYWSEWKYFVCEAEDVGWGCRSYIV